MARNAGLAASQGHYVYFMDPDDLLVDNALSELLPRLISSMSDMLMANYCRFTDGEDYSHLLRVYQNYSQIVKTGEQAFLDNLSPYECYIWRLIIKRTLLTSNKIDFKPFWYEDTLFCQETFLKAESVIITSFQLYVYRLRSGSFTSSMNMGKMIDLNSCLSALIKIKEKGNMSPVVSKKLKNNIFSSFSYGIWCITHNDGIYKERKVIVSDLKAKIPPSHFMFYANLKQMFVSVMFRFFPFVYLLFRRIC